MPADTQYYSSCELIRPNRESDTYYKMTYNVWKNKWYPKFKQSWYNKDVNKYNKCLIQSKDGRAKVEIALDCTVEANKKKGQCKIHTGPGSAGTNPFSANTGQNLGTSQKGLGQDKGASMLNFETMDKRILIGGAAIALLLIMR